MSEENKSPIVSDEVQNFEGQHIKVALIQKPACQVKLEIDVAPEATKAAYKKALKKINKEVSIPGFRKGKAPERFIISNYGKYIDQEWREIILHSAFHDSLDLVKIYPLGERSVKSSKIESLSDVDGAKVIFEYESEAQVPHLNYEELEMQKVEPKQVSDEDVEKRLIELQEQRTAWLPVEEDRIVEEGDFVELNIYSIDEDPERELCKDTRFKVDNEEMGQWLREIVIGMKKGDVAEGVSELDENADETVKKNFKPTKCRVELKRIVLEEKPEIDDEFAKKFELKDLEELRQKVREQLESEAKKVALDENRQKVEDLVLDKVSFEVPASMFEGERKARIREKLKALKDAGENDEQISAKKDLIEEEIALDAERALKMFFIVRKVAGENNINVPTDELNMAVMRYQIYNRMMHSADDQATKELQSHMYMTLLMEKVKDFMLSKICVAE